MLDVEQIRRWAPSVGRHVTLVSVDGARHDVVLSREPVRSQVYAEIGRWLAAYVDAPGRVRTGPTRQVVIAASASDTPGRRTGRTRLP